MSFSSVKISELSRTVKPKRSMSNGRLLGSAVSWILGLSLVYTSIFYVPAFFDFRGAIGVSSQHSLAQQNQQSSIIRPLVDLLNLDRTYITAGQSVDVAYNFSTRSKSELVFYKCQSQIILEVFKCNPVIVDRLPLGKALSGQKSLKINSNGFYAFEVISDSEAGTYQVAWQRRY